ncbi:MAG: hypothetical protein GYA52_04075 [Chloroflexi bacterium]|nr:hypothetical protein [Chloroflexota bacterium]
MSATERKEKMADLRIENNELRQANNVLTKMNAELLERIWQWQTGKPEETGDYIARVLWSDGSGGVHVRHFIKGVGWDVYYGNVIEWMPLPK